MCHNKLFASDTYPCTACKFCTKFHTNGNVYKDICNPITKEFREELYRNILEAFENLQKQDHEQEKEQERNEFRTAPDFPVSVTPFERGGSNIKGLARIYYEDSFIVNIRCFPKGKSVKRVH